MRKDFCYRQSQHNRSSVEGALHAKVVEEEVDLVDGDEAILNWVVQLKGIEELGGSIVSVTSNLGGDSTSPQ